MRRSTERIITTHVGSLSRPEALREAWSKPANDAAQEQQFEALLRSSVAEVVDQQLKAGVDVPNDGEFGKPMRSTSDLAAWGTYIFGRLSGFGPTPPGAAAPDRALPGQPMRIVGERWEQRRFPGLLQAWGTYRARHPVRPVSGRSPIPARTRCDATSRT